MGGGEVVDVLYQGDRPWCRPSDSACPPGLKCRARDRLVAGERARGSTTGGHRWEAVGTPDQSILHTAALA